MKKIYYELKFPTLVWGYVRYLQLFIPVLFELNISFSKPEKIVTNLKFIIQSISYNLWNPKTKKAKNCNKTA